VSVTPIDAAPAVAGPALAVMDGAAPVIIAPDRMLADLVGVRS